MGERKRGNEGGRDGGCAGGREEGRERGEVGCREGGGKEDGTSCAIAISKLRSSYAIAS